MASSYPQPLSHHVDPRTAAMQSLLVVAACGLMLAAVNFNAALAAVNAHVSLSKGTVMLAEGVIVLGAVAVALASWRPQMLPAVMMLGFIIFFAVVRAIVTGEFQAKFFRDVALIPIFIMLGMAFTDRYLVRAVTIVQCIVFFVFLIEAIDQDLFTQIFRIRDYYINTRGVGEDMFYNTDSELFASATRPNERFIPFIDMPRASSVFLEPVSLGNYCSIIMAFVLAVMPRLSRRQLAFFLFTTAALLVGCDGRLGVVTSAILVAASLVVIHLPAKSAVFYLPLGIVGIFVLVNVVNASAGADDFAGRLAHTAELVMHLDVDQWLGVSTALTESLLDSGLCYLIVTQSVIGLYVLWIYISCLPAEDTDEQVRFTHCLCIYLTLSMMVSYSILTIKTAALLWFIQGALQAPADEEPEDEGGASEPTRSSILSISRNASVR